MRMALIILIAIVVLAGCVPSGNSNKVPPITEAETPVSASEPGPVAPPAPGQRMPYAFVLDPGFDRSEGIYSANYEKYQIAGLPIAFDFDELAWDAYPLGEWSIDELEEKYGKAKKIEGSIFMENFAEVSGRWNSLYIYIQIPRDGKLSFDDIDSYLVTDFFPLSAEDRTVKMPIFEISVFSADMPLPRGLKIGESSIEEIRAAYPIEEWDNGYAIGYKYVFFDKIAKKHEIEKPDMGYIKYNCDVNGILYEVEIGLPSEFRSLGI